MRWLVLVMLLGCSSDETSLAGVYVIQDWTENLASCGAPGPSILSGQQDHGVMVKNADFLGQKFVNATTCLDTEECNQFLNDNTIHLPFALDGGSDAEGWSGNFVVVFDNTTACSGDVTHAILTAEGDGVTLRIEKTHLASFPRDASDACTTDDAQTVAKTVPCTSVQIITAL
jgi:hypothetical protein